MAELNPELPQVGAQGSVGGVSPSIEAMTAGGRGLQQAGQAISEGGSFLFRKTAQQETANVYADMAAAREKHTENLSNALATGQLDTEEFASQLKEDTDKIGEGLSTPESRNFFERQQARLTGAMLLKASHVKGQIAANDTIDQFTQAGNSLSNTAMNDPTQFGDIVEGNEEMIKAAVDGGQLPEALADKLRKHMNTQIADGAAKGLAQMDPGKNPDGTPKENALLATLKHMDPKADDNSSLYKYLDADHISNLQAYARRMDEVRLVHDDQVQSNQEKLLRLKGQVWLNQNSSAIMTGQTDPKAVINNPNLTIEQKNMAVEMIRKYSKESVQSDPSFVNHVENKIINGDISSRDDLIKEYDSGKMSGDDFWKLAKKIDETPDGKIVQNNRKLLFQMGDQSLRFKGVGGSYTASGDQANYSYRQEVEAKASAFVAEGKGKLSDFYSNHNAKDPDSPMAILNKYRMSPMDKAQAGAQEAVQQATGQAPKGVQYSTSPTKDIPSQPPKPPANKDMIQPGETISDWKKRTGK